MNAEPTPSRSAGDATATPNWLQAVVATWRQAILPHALFSIVVIPLAVFAMSKTVPGMMAWEGGWGGPLITGWMMFAMGMFLFEFALAIPCPNPSKYWWFEALARFVPLFFYYVTSPELGFGGDGLHHADNLPKAWWLGAELMRGLLMGQFRRGHVWQPWEWKRLRFAGYLMLYPAVVLPLVLEFPMAVVRFVEVAQMGHYPMNPFG